MTTIHKAQVNSSSTSCGDHMEILRKSYGSDQSQQDKQWQITSINEEYTPVINGDSGSRKIEEQYTYVSHNGPILLENTKWAIDSIQALADGDDDVHVDTVECQRIPGSSIRTDRAFTENGKYEIQSISVINDAEKVHTWDHEWDICSINTRDEEESVSNGSQMMEESWTEHHTIPIHSTSIEMRTQSQPRQTSVFTIAPATKGQFQSRTVFSENNQTKYPMSEGFGTNVDHYTYQYENNIKTAKLKQLANKNDHHHNIVYSSNVQAPTYSNKGPQNTHGPTTNCMQQSIHVDNDDEDILGIPLILDENQNPIRNIKDTQSFNSITENVSFQIQNFNAQMKIVIGVEMFHNTDPCRQLWKRKHVKVTRLVELDLSKVRDKRRLQDIIDRCNANNNRIRWKDNDEFNATGRDHKLKGKNAYAVFYNLMAITHEEEGEGDKKDNLYLTRGASGNLTSVVCEPQFLLSGLEERQNSSLYY